MSREPTREPIAALMEEHRLFERVLGAFDAWLTTIERGATVGRELDDFVTVFAELVDVHHHGKEEDILFTAMMDAGFPAHGGPLAVMLHEHDLGRAEVHALRAAGPAASRPGVDGAEARRSIITHGRTYAQLMRAHIRKEDKVLYPMAREVLGEAFSAVALACQAYDDDQERRGRVAALTALATSILSRGG